MKTLLVFVLAIVSHAAFGQDINLSTAAPADTSEWPLLRIKIKDETFFINIEPTLQHYFNRGQLRSRIQDYRGAIADFSHCIELEPENSQIYGVYYARGGTKEYQGDLSGAIADFTQAIRLQPAFEWAWNDRGQTYIKQNKFADAESDLLQAIKLHPDWAIPFFNLGLVYGKTNNTQKCIQYYTKSIEIKADNPIAYNNLGKEYFIVKRYDRAIDCYNKALRFFPNYTTALKNRAEAKMTIGDHSGACQDIKAAADLGNVESLKYFNEFCVKK